MEKMLNTDKIDEKRKAYEKNTFLDRLRDRVIKKAEEVNPVNKQLLANPLTSDLIRHLLR